MRILSLTSLGAGFNPSIYRFLKHYYGGIDITMGCAVHFTSSAMNLSPSSVTELRLQMYFDFCLVKSLCHYDVE